jgi:hypothetical protein
VLVSRSLLGPWISRFGINFQNGPSCPLVLGFGLFSFFSSFGFEYCHISYFYGMLKPFGPFGFFYTPNFI